MENNIFKEVALMNGVTEEEVRLEIENAITEACKEPNAPISKIGNGKTPTPEEVMEYVLKEVARSNMN